jgi:glycosyltransferase involved in cell wall biosynthesis
MRREDAFVTGDEVDLSVVVPLLDEEENVEPLVRAVTAALAEKARWELILVNDGSTDGTEAAIDRAAEADRRVRALHLARRYGQSVAMRAGFDHARAPVVASLDGDLQNDPEDLPRLLQKLEEGFDLVVGFRVGRKDPFLTRKVPSWAANRLVGLMTGVRVRDSGCSLKAYRRELLDRLTLYSDMHRFIPALAAATAGARIAEVPVRHHARRAGRSKYGLRRVVQVVADLLAVQTIRSFRNRPLLLFGGGAVLAGGASLVFAVMAAVSYLTFSPAKASALVLPGTSAALFGFAVYLLLLGLVAEVAVERWSRRGRPVLPLGREGWR